MKIAVRVFNHILLFFRLKRIALFNKNIKIDKGVKFYKNVSVKTPLGGEINIGKNTVIYSGAMIQTYGGDIRIGENCTVNPYVILYGHGGLNIGNGVRIAAHCVIIPANHTFDSIDKFIYEQGVTGKGITIEDDVWIGANVTILDGVVIKKGTIVAAGAVVTKSTESFSIIGGVPAKLIKKR